MAGYYDKNKDYSKELQRTDLSSTERAQLETERQNKINAVYGGKEPNMIGSDKTYSQTYGSSSKSGSSGSSSGSSASSGGSIYGVANNDTAIKNYKQDGVTYQAGADMSRRTDLAGKIAVSNGYTVFYDENGYARKAIKGVADYTPTLDTNASNGSYNTSGAWTDNEMLSEADRQKIAAIRQQLQAGQITGDQANQAANAIRAGYGYSIDKNGYVTDSGALSAVNDFRKKLGLDTDSESSALGYYRYLMDTDISPSAQQSGQVKSFDQWAAENGGYTTGGAQRVTDIGGGTTSSGSTTVSYDVGDGSDYLKTLYAQNIAAELAALKDAYEKNVATLDASRTQIGQTYDIARNSTANKNAQSRSQFQEYAAANGLNTGTSGQAALAQDAVYQQNLADIDRQQAADLSELDLQRSQLDTEYQNAIAQAEATGNAALAEALYEEYVRQQNLSAKQTSTAQTTTKPSLTASQAKAAVESGLVTDEVIAAYEYYYGQGAYSQYGTGTASTGNKSTGKSGNTLTSYNNGSLSADQVKAMQSYYGVTADGKWGTNSTKAAGGLSADEAWAAYSGQQGGKSFGAITYQTLLSQGNREAADSYLAQHWDSMTDSEKTRAHIIAAQYGG